MEKIRSLFSKSSSQSSQILSDLHLEVGQQYSTFEIPPSAPYLVLAGDIGRLQDYDSYLSFLARQSQRFEKVFLVLGNHEFYGLSFAAGLEQARKLEKEPILDSKIVLLHQKCLDVPNSAILILGCTLWSEVPDDARQEKITNWSVPNHNAAYVAGMSWLKIQIADIQKAHKENLKGKPERTTVIITHHALETSNPQHVGNPWTSAFATDLLDGEDWFNVKLWVFGHTHFTTEFKKDRIKVVSNQRGYVLPGSVPRTDNVKDKKMVFNVRKVVRVNDRS